MIEGSGQIRIECPAHAVYDFVLDMDRYRHADPKIAKVFWERWDGDHGRMKFAGTLRGLPAPPLVVNVHREPFSRIEITADESTFIGWLARFRGSFEIEERSPGSCEVSHVERFDFRRPVRWIADPLFRRWLAEDTTAEMLRLKAMIERNAPLGQ
jgi:hypothetical protein